MKYFPLIIISFLFMSSSDCQKDKNKTAAKSEAAIPGCITKKIEEIKAQKKWNPPAEISEYIYNDKTVYLISADCCDQYINLYDANCIFICAPGGGITGKGDGKCKDFFKEAKLVKTIWKDDRQ